MLLHGVYEDIDQATTVGLRLSADGFFSLAAKRQAFGQPLPLLSPLKDPGDAFHFPDVGDYLSLQVLGQLRQHEFPEPVVPDVEADLVGGDLLAKNLRRPAVDLESQPVPILVAPPAADGMSLHAEPDGDFGVRRHLAGEVEPPSLLTRLAESSLHGPSPQGSPGPGWPSPSPSGPGPASRRWLS